MSRKIIRVRRERHNSDAPDVIIRGYSSVQRLLVSIPAHPGGRSNNAAHMFTLCDVDTCREWLNKKYRIT